jgi:F-type H+-transporting ATPase subunit a
MSGFLSTQTMFLASAEGGHKDVQPSFIGTTIYVALVFVILFGLLSYAKKGINGRVFKNPLTQAFEQLYLFLENMCVGIIGAHGRKYIPLIGTLWLVIFVGNLVALFFGFSPTASLGFNLGMAVISIAYVQYEGVKANGLIGHLSHFAGPKMGPAMIAINILIFVIEIVSELMKNASLSLRLYGNIFGGGKAVHAMNELGHAAYIPVGEFLLPVKLLTVVVQAMIFCLLTCVYISLVTAHHDDHGDEHAHGEDHGHAPAPAHA